MEQAYETMKRLARQFAEIGDTVGTGHSIVDDS
jgi:hypothetical protein